MWPQGPQGAETVHARQPEIEQDHVRPPARCFADRLLACADRPHVEVVVLETRPQRALHLDLIIDHEHATAHRLAGTAASGSVKVNRGPLRLFSARMVPPCASTTRLEIPRPSPVPALRRVQKGSKIRSRPPRGTAGLTHSSQH